MSVANNLQLILERIETAAIKTGRSSEDIKLIAVSKTRSVEEVQSAIESGVNVFGENTIQDAMSKIPNIGTETNEWHFIGHLQSKKAKSIPGYFSWIHTIDSLKLAEKLSFAMTRHDPQQRLNCLIQLNVSGEESKSGIAVSELMPFIEELMSSDLPCLDWRGLMTMGIQNNVDKTRHAFATLRKCLTQCAGEFALGQFDQLSMGMSDDYQIAIEEGSTMIRLGTSIFGKR